MSQREKPVPTLREAVAERIAVEPTAFSSDGVTFGFEVEAVSGVGVGTRVVLDSPHGELLAQVESIELVRRPGTRVEIRFDEPIGVRPGVVAHGGTVSTDERVLAGGGRILGRLLDGELQPPGDLGFAEAPIRPARPEEIALPGRGGGPGTLEVGRLIGGDVAAHLAAAGFSRHTFLCGQSGSGKTYSTGVLLEQLLLGTDLRIVVLDPNSDHVHLDELEGVGAVETLSGNGLRLHVRDLEPDLQARMLRLDPLDDRAEYHAFRTLLARQGESPVDRLPDPDTATDPAVRALALRAQNLGVDRWDLWGRLESTSVLRRLDDDDWRALVVDLGSLGSEAERDVVAAAVLGRLWSQRSRRRPVLIVVDEAHNVAPSRTEDAVRALAAEVMVTLAGEGRKFGLHLLVATQRPAKVHPNVVSQCDNLVLMRLNSTTDVDDVAQVFSHVPSGMVRAAPGFGLGEALVAGRVSPTPQLLRFGSRLTREGGGDVPTTWVR